MAQRGAMPRRVRVSPFPLLHFGLLLLLTSAHEVLMTTGSYRVESRPAPSGAGRTLWLVSNGRRHFRMGSFFLDGKRRDWLLVWWVQSVVQMVLAVFLGRETERAVRAHDVKTQLQGTLLWSFKNDHVWKLFPNAGCTLLQLSVPSVSFAKASTSWWVPQSQVASNPFQWEKIGIKPVR